MPQTPPYTRRAFLRTVVLTTASLATLPRLAQADDAGKPAMDYVDLGAASQFDSDSVWTRVVLPDKYNQEVIFLRKTADGKSFQAVSARCTHKGCVVAYSTDSHQFECPCHHGKFDDNAVNIAGPPKTPLHTLDTKLKDKNLLVQSPLMTSSSQD